MKLYTEVVTSFQTTIPDEFHQQFNLSANATTHLFDLCLNLQIKGLVKIRIELLNAPDSYLLSPPNKLMPRVIIDKPFDFTHFFAQDRWERRAIVLETLYECIVEMCKVCGYDLAPFTAAYNKVKELNYVNRLIHDKLTVSKDRQHKAGIEIEVNETEATICALFTDRDERPVKRVELIRTIPHYMFMYRVIHKGKWLNDKVYVVSDRNGYIQFKASLDSDVAELVLHPNEQVSEARIREVLESVKPEQLGG